MKKPFIFIFPFFPLKLVAAHKISISIPAPLISHSNSFVEFRPEMALATGNEFSRSRRILDWPGDETTAPRAQVNQPTIC